MLSICEQFLTRRQRILKMNQLRGRNLTISPIKKQLMKNIKQFTTFKNPVKTEIEKQKYKALKGI